MRRNISSVSTGCQLDTEVPCNVILFNDIIKLCEIKQTGKSAMRPTTAKLRLYDESMVQELGECDFQCKFKDEQH